MDKLSKCKKELECWVCRYCGVNSKFEVDPEKPKGWTNTDEHGLICSACTKGHKAEEEWNQL